MKFSTYFSKQARKPSGLFGFFYMSRIFNKGNAKINELVNDTLAIQENEHGLEIGFGTGILLSAITENLENGLMEGVDFSKSMLSIAGKKNKKAIKEGKVKLTLGDFDKTLFAENSFDKIFTVHTIYFWKNPEATISKIYSLLKPGGKVVIGFKDKSVMEKMPLNKDVFQYYSTDDVANLLSAGKLFNNVVILSNLEANDNCYCAVGIKNKNTV